MEVGVVCPDSHRPSPRGLGWLKLFYCIQKILNFLIQPLRVGMIETFGLKLMYHIWVDPTPVDWDDWNASILLYKECSINDPDYEGWDDWSWLIFPWARLYLYPTPAGWDDWNKDKKGIESCNHKTLYTYVWLLRLSFYGLSHFHYKTNKEVVTVPWKTK